MTTNNHKQNMYSFLEENIQAETTIKRDKNLILFKEQKKNFAIYMIDKTSEYEELLTTTNSPTWKGYIKPDEEDYANKLLVSFIVRQNNFFSVPSIIFLNPIESYKDINFDKESPLGKEIYENSKHIQNIFHQKTTEKIEEKISASPLSLNKSYLSTNYPRTLHVQNYYLGLLK